jgi:hypothetical protein
MRNEEIGSASLLIDLSYSNVTVYHGTDQKEVLGSGRVSRGDWNKLTNFLRDELGINWEDE